MLNKTMADVKQSTNTNTKQAYAHTHAHAHTYLGDGGAEENRWVFKGD